MLKNKIPYLVLSLVLIGCGDPPPEQGYVRDKRFVPAHWEDGYRSEPYQDCGMHLNYEGDVEFGCQTKMRSVYESHHHFVQDSWSLKLEECETKDGKQKCRHGWKRVDESTYHTFELGMFYPTPR